ncbi:MAG: FAD-dependent oxidoreductase [Alphaproteobacteria bacterium]|nr:FAD-dependent oxidoreductase [Alphaproteobacteria bacterium]
MAVRSAHGKTFLVQAPVLVVGAGACGLCAALAARDAGADVLVLERDAVPRGDTGISGGFVPAALTEQQRRQGIDDSPERFAEDIWRMARGRTDEAYLRLITRESAPTLEWLSRHGLTFQLTTDISYAGHSHQRMHAPPGGRGAGLAEALLVAARAAGARVVGGAETHDLFVDDERRVLGVSVRHADGRNEEIGCGALVLASGGFGGDRELIDQYIPELRGAMFLGHTGNTGQALRWGLELGAALADLGSYQGHGAVAHPHRFLVWDALADGGIQVNDRAERFGNEAQNNSEHARSVLAQPGGLAWNIYNESGHRTAERTRGYQEAQRLNLVKKAVTVQLLAAITGLPFATLSAALREVATAHESGQPDRFGRSFVGASPLAPPYYAIRVTAAFSHTQGGLVVDEQARVQRATGGVFPNLFAGGGAARGLSGPSRWGYMAGNGLLTAVVLGRIAGTNAARLTA